MPRILDSFGIPLNETTFEADTTPDPSIAWTMDPYAPVPEDYRHLVNNPNEDSNTDAQEEGQ
jgi:hypothetical protein